MGIWTFPYLGSFFVCQIERVVAYLLGANLVIRRPICLSKYIELFTYQKQKIYNEKKKKSHL
jgi:hypothetical protein